MADTLLGYVSRSFPDDTNNCFYLTTSVEVYKRVLSRGDRGMKRVHHDQITARETTPTWAHPIIGSFMLITIAYDPSHVPEDKGLHLW